MRPGDRQRRAAQQIGFRLIDSHAQGPQRARVEHVRRTIRLRAGRPNRAHLRAAPGQAGTSRLVKVGVLQFSAS